MELSHFVNALGNNHQSAEGRHLFVELGLDVSQLKPYPAGLDDRRFYSDHDRGVHLQFEDEGALRKIPYHDPGEGPWVLTQVAFDAGRGKRSRQYKGQLPHEIRFDMTRKEVKDLLGEPRAANESSHSESWFFDDYRLVVNYEPVGGALKLVGMFMLDERM